MKCLQQYFAGIYIFFAIEVQINHKLALFDQYNYKY